MRRHLPTLRAHKRLGVGGLGVVWLLLWLMLWVVLLRRLLTPSTPLSLEPQCPWRVL